MKRSNLLIAASSGALIAILVFSPALAAPVYTITDLGSLGGTLTEGTAINARGEVTGYSYTAGNSHSRAFLYNGASMRDLGQFYVGNTENTGGFGINARGQVTGYDIDEGSGRRAFLWPIPGAFPWVAMQNIGTLGTTALRAIGYDSWGQGINDSGEVTGYSTATYDGPLHAFLYDGASMHDLGTPGGTTSYGYGINASGKVTGNAATNGDSATHAFLYDGASMQDLGTLGGTDSFGRAINASGKVTGFSRITGSYDLHAFLYDGASMQDLGTLGGTDSYGYGINASGEVVGWSDTDLKGGYAAFLYDDGAMYDLNDLISPTDPLYGSIHFTGAAGINDLGQIVANTATRAFLLTPSIPEPSTWALLVTGFLGLGLAWRCRAASRDAMQRTDVAAGTRRAAGVNATRAHPFFGREER
jgi:probable HAF family extracellular repeat protein